MVARSRLKGSEFTETTQFINLISTAENAYWIWSPPARICAWPSARKIRPVSSWSYSRSSWNWGALSPLDIYQAEQTLASRKLDVAQAKFRLAELEDTLRKQIGADLDPSARTIPIVLTETVDVPDTTEAIDRERWWQKATYPPRTRPEGGDPEPGYRRSFARSRPQCAASEPGVDRELHR